MVSLLTSGRQQHIVLEQASSLSAPYAWMCLSDFGWSLGVTVAALQVPVGVPYILSACDRHG